MAAEVQVLGAYRVKATRKLFLHALEVKYAGRGLQGDECRQAEKATLEELSHVVLLEVLISQRDKRFNVGDFGQKGSDQAPYDEHFLSDDGSRVIAEGFDIPAGKTLRCVFFLHFFDPTKPLETSYGQMTVPPLRPMPARLRRLVPYEPTD
jgi:hypothetical protein